MALFQRWLSLQFLLAVSPGVTQGLKGGWFGWGLQSCRNSRVEVEFDSAALPGSSARLPPGLALEVGWGSRDFPSLLPALDTDIEVDVVR